MMTRVVLSVLAILLLIPAASAADAVPGISAAEPADGPKIKTDAGWMVPYDVTIPGTEATFRMVPVPGGEYQMGSAAAEAGRSDDESPVRKVRIEPFWIAECEVTWAEYKEFMSLYTAFKEFQSRGERLVSDDNRVDAITAPTPLYQPDFIFEYGEDPKQPAVSMTQYAAKQYSKWVSAVTGQQYRLPTEAEWEYACRAGSTTAYSFGDDASQLGEYGWFADNSEAKGTRQVRLKKPNPWGLYDMHGNAAEWVLDAYAPYEAAEVVDGSGNWIRSESPDPRVVRGGSWEFSAELCRSAARFPSNYKIWREFDPNLPKSPWWCTTDPARGVGFRLVRFHRDVEREKIEEAWKIDCEDIQLDVQDRLLEGRGVLGIVDKELPAALKKLSE